jgi:hypothetical protein
MTELFVLMLSFFAVLGAANACPLRVDVVDQELKPMPQAVVQLLDQETRTLVSEQRAQSSVEFCNLLLGRYVVRVIPTSPHYPVEIDALWVLPDAPQRLRIVLNSIPLVGGIGGVGNSCSIHVLVVDDDGRAVTGSALEGIRTRYTLSSTGYYSGLLQIGDAERFFATAERYRAASEEVRCDNGGLKQVNLILKAK